MNELLQLLTLVLILSLPAPALVQDGALLGFGAAKERPVALYHSPVGQWRALAPIFSDDEPPFEAEFLGISANRRWRADLLPNRVTVRELETGKVLYSVVADDARIHGNSLCVLYRGRIAVLDEHWTTNKKSKQLGLGIQWTTIDKTCGYVLGTKARPSQGDLFRLYAIPIDHRTNTPIDLQIEVALGNVDMPRKWSALGDGSFLVFKDVALGRTEAWIVHGRTTRCISRLAGGELGFVIDSAVRGNRVVMLLADEQFATFLCREYVNGHQKDIVLRKDAWKVLLLDAASRIGIMSWANGYWVLQVLSSR